MALDLSLSQSFGGLRIANPDDGELLSPNSQQPESQDAPTQSAASSQSGNSTLNLPLDAGRNDNSLGFDPTLYSTDSFADNELTQFPSQAISTTSSHTPQAAHSPVSPTSPMPAQAPQPPFRATPQSSQAGISRQPSQSASQKKPQRSSAVPAGYQPHALAASAAYVAMNQRPYQSNARPNSAYLQGPNTSLPPRDDGYRLRKEPSQTSLSTPRRVKSTSRKISGAAQAGVPVNEANHMERNYVSRPPVFAGAAVPPRRKSSRGLGQTRHMQNGSSNGYVGGSPYVMEGGPSPSSDDWQEKGAAVGVRQTIDLDGQPVTQHVRKGVKDFKFGQLLGEGSYSQVMLAQDRATLKEYAIKILDKRHIIKEKKVKYVNIEKDTLNRLTTHPGVVRLYYTFQDERSLYFVLDCASNGELLGVLKKMGTFDEECTQFYAAQLLDTIEYMHSRGVIHRDLKPENILLDERMHVKITDFGTAKLLDTSRRSRQNSAAGAEKSPPGDAFAPDDPGTQDDRANSFVGTAEYVSPELLTDKSACKASDLWAFGCIVYQLLAGRPPFKAGSEYLTFQKIVKLDYKFPSGFPSAARDLIERCLVLDPRQRITIEHIKGHDFFSGIVWGRGLWTQKAPQLKPYQPPAQGLIRLNTNQQAPMNDNGNLDPNNSYQPDMQPSHSVRPVHISSHSPAGIKPSPRPSPRVITELPPPSQLDIEWSPVLSKDNERIFKLGNLSVLTTSSRDSPPGHRHGDKDGKEDSGSKESGGGAFKRFFGGGGKDKKKTRMVMVTSNARLLVANGPDEKKIKFEVNLLADGTSWMRSLDPKGFAFWCVENKDKHFTFEDPKASTSDLTHTVQAAQDWLDAIERARDIALSRSQTGSSYSTMLTSPSNSKSPTINLNFGGDSTNASVSDVAGPRYGGSSGALIDQAANAEPRRNHLHKPRDSKGGDGGGGDGDGEEGKQTGRGFKRFSKRQSKSGLAAVF